MRLNNIKIFKKAYEKLSKDPVMKFLIKKLKNKIGISDRKEINHAKAISNLIIEQQISYKAAITVKRRFNLLIKGMSNQNILSIKNDRIQSIGISKKKAEYIKNVYTFFNQFDSDLNKMNHDDVFNELIKIKGVGSWTINMFLLFNLGNPNIFSSKDFALINSIKLNYNLKSVSSKKIDSLKKNWEPFMSVASLLLWASIENEVFYTRDKCEK
tara:strand:+ start:4038 stop:4676 length:639 start_codon:yes stop_codon:yes gene_type:complete